MNYNHWRRIGTAAAVIGSIAGTYFLSARSRTNRKRLPGKQQRELDRNLTVPANATFGLVWPAIYTGATALAIHQALPSQRNNPRYENAMPWLAGSYVLNALFGYFFSSEQKEDRIGAGLTTIAILPTALGIHRQLEIGRTAVPNPERTIRKSISLYAGWLTAASVISTGNLLIQGGWKVRPAEAARWTYGVLTITGALGMVVSRRLRDPYYLTPLVAAFAGIAAKQYGRQNGVAALAGAWALLTTADFVQQFRRQTRAEFSEQPGRTPTDEPEALSVDESENKAARPSEEATIAFV